ncbi:uncharacterized protein TNCT_200321 [Trichonephila clavata]|uniref:Uncharacterized protein n=1 Tax=Trichonephila clavata TaxID=2740835 RepID=A0A8X6L8W3_TRICU|nr:uncharacterized protein TNCT_200321 [Trichonephila clavata]
MVNLTFQAFCLAPLFAAGVFAYRALGVINHLDFWTFSYGIPYDTFEIPISFNGGYTYYRICIETPLLITFSICLLLHHYGLLLLQFNNTLKSVDMSRVPSRCLEISNTYNRMEEKLRVLIEILSAPLFIILLISFVNLYTALVFYLQVDVPSFLLPEIYISASAGAAIICSLTLCCSKIPKYILEIKATARVLINKSVSKDLKSEKEIHLLRGIEKSDVLYLSACGMVEFQKSLLLSSFGTFFTYALLIENS